MIAFDTDHVVMTALSMSATANLFFLRSLYLLLQKHNELLLGERGLLVRFARLEAIVEPPHRAD